MRIMPGITAACVVLSVTLAGCGGTGNGTDTSSTTSPSGGHDDHTTTPTSRAPNVPPDIQLAVTDLNGTATNVTFTGGTLLFDASASSDADDGLAAIAMVAQDANTTYVPALLYSEGAFTTANYTFPNAGVVNVTVSGIDKRGDVTTIRTLVYVDLKLIVGSDKTFQGVAPDAAFSAKACKGPTDQAAADDLVWAKHTFDVQNGTTFVTATVQAPGKAEIAICDPAGMAVSEESTTTVTSSAGTLFAAGTYYVSVMSGAANAKSPVEVVVHYEPAQT